MELTLDQALQRGVEAHKAGKVQDAERYYTAILKTDPKHPDANHNIGVLAVGVGKVETALPFFKTALDANPSIAQFWISYIDALIKLERITDAKEVFDQAKSKDAKGHGFDQLQERLEASSVKLRETEKYQDPPQDQIQALMKLHKQRKLHQLFEETQVLTKQYANNLILWNLMGTSATQIGKLDEAIYAFQKALSLKPDSAAAYYNIGNALRAHDKLDEAIEAYKKALLIKPDFAQACNNMGNILKDQDKLEEAVDAYKKALSLMPDYADAYYNMGVAVQEQGKLNEAIEVYKKALSLNPDYADAYNNMGIALKERGKLEEAVEAYNKALSLEPDYAEAHRNLSSIKKYTVADAQFVQLQEMYSRKDLSEDTRCKLSFALAKMYEDIGELDQAFGHLSKGNALRKKLLSYSIEQDEQLFIHLKKAQPRLSKNKLELNEGSIGCTPIFILGMPRSGTTLVEQIISSHSKVTGAGELKHASMHGFQLSINSVSIDKESISNFRKKYLIEISKVSNGKHFVTDKMPQNFRFIPLICAAIPEAKIVHVQREPAATCWSNYKHYFTKDVLGYCYDLNDVVDYYKLYNDLMNFWQSKYNDRIYNLDYEKLTGEQEEEIKKLLNYLELDWEDSCLTPHKNKRSVRTASQQQVRKKIYQGSSEVWRKYELYLNGAFDQLQERLEASSVVVKSETKEDIPNQSNTSGMKEPPDDQLKRLLNLYMKGQYHEALNKGSELLEKFSKSVTLYNLLGAINTGLGKLDEAIEAYNKALSFNPDYADAHYNLGNVFKDQGKFEEAIEAYNKALSLNPDYADTYNNMGIVLNDQGKLEEAIEAYNKALSLNPNYAEAYYNSGISLESKGKLEEAVAAYNKAILLKPDYAEAYWNLSGVVEDISEAKKWVKECLNVNPNHLKAKLTLSALRFYEGDKSEFKKLIKSSLKNHPLARSMAWAFSLPKLPPLHFHRWAVFDHMTDLSKKERPFYEFGVWRGEAFRYLIKTFKKGYGFDTFEGLPEDWHNEKAGTYSSDSNVPKIKGGKFIVGRFEDTLPGFFAKKRPMASIINFDADLYSSTICALNFSKPVIDKHTILIFDEFITNKNWEQDEYKALEEFCANNQYSYEVIAISFFTKQVAVKIIGI